MPATISLLGLYRWDNTLFDTMTIPSAVNRSTLVNNLLVETAELESLYTDPTALKTMLEYYSSRQMPTWQKVADACAVTYNPLYNTDRYETDSETDSDTETRNLAGSANTDAQTSGTGTSTLSTGSFNGTEVKAKDQTDNTSGSTSSTDTTTTDTGTITHSHTHSRTHRAYGNIGVTTSQEMLKQEIEVSRMANVYEYIIKDLKSRFCLMVY